MGIDTGRIDGAERGCIDILKSNKLKPSAIATERTVMRGCRQRAVDIPFE